MQIVPNSKIILLKNPIEIDYANELTFNTATDQYNYFYSLTKLEFDKLTYQRKDNTCRIPTSNETGGITFEDLLGYNYCMYQNTAFDDKWFYAFIKKVTFDNPGMTLIELETDVWQTWMFDITLKNSYVEREHVNDDTIGKNTVPEGVELGEYIINSHDADNYNNQLTYIIGSTVYANGLEHITGGIFNGIPSGIRYYRYDTIGYPADTTTNTFLGALNALQNGAGDAIVSLFIAPKWLAGGTSTNIPIANSNSPITNDLTVSRISTLNGYTPKCNKMLTFPYCYILVSNVSGQATVYHQEVWTANNNNMTLKMVGALTPGCSIKLYPYNYNGTADNYDEGISLGKFPQLNWATDQYTNWLTLNGMSLGAIKLNAEQAGYLKGATNLALGVGGLATGNILGIERIGAGVGDVLGTMQESYRHSLIPATINGSLNIGDVITASGENRFHIFKMTIKAEYAKIIDGYFNAYGYKVNSFKVPNVTGRTYWNYVKTIGCNIVGDIPQEDMNKIKKIFDSGITFWHDATKFLDYSQNNTIVS